MSPPVQDAERRSQVEKDVALAKAAEEETAQEAKAIADQLEEDESFATKFQTDEDMALAQELQNKLQLELVSRFLIWCRHRSLTSCVVQEAQEKAQLKADELLARKTFAELDGAEANARFEQMQADAKLAKIEQVSLQQPMVSFELSHRSQS